MKMQITKLNATNAGSLFVKFRKRNRGSKKANICTADINDEIFKIRDMEPEDFEMASLVVPFEDWKIMFNDGVSFENRIFSHQIELEDGEIYWLLTEKYYDETLGLRYDLFEQDFQINTARLEN